MEKTTETYNMNSSQIQRSIALSRQLDDLHQMLYRKGGVHSANEAVEEISKMLLMRLYLREEPHAKVHGVPLSEVLNSSNIEKNHDTSLLKKVFSTAIRSPKFSTVLPDGTTEPLWSEDEPFRLNNLFVIAQAFTMLETLFEDSHVGDFPDDILGMAFDIFLRGKHDHSGGLGTYLTPSVLTDALAAIAVELVDPLSSPDTFCGDPCAGTGRFLMSLLKAVENKARRENHLEEFSSFKHHGLFGADQSSSAVAKTRTNLMLCGVKQPLVFTVEDSITDTNVDTMQEKLSIILTNPPFGENTYDSPKGIERTHGLFPMMKNKKRIDPSLAFVSRCLDLLAPGGVLGIVLPDGVIEGSSFQSVFGSGHTKVKNEDISVEMVISLPSVMFAGAGTVVKTSAVFLRKGSTNTSVVLAQADHIGSLKQGNRLILDPAGNDLVHIVDTITKFHKDNAEEITKLRSTDENIVQNHVLSAKPLVVCVNKENLISLSASHYDATSLLAKETLSKNSTTTLRSKITFVKTKIAKESSDLPFVSVLHVDDLGITMWHEAERYSPLTRGQYACSGDLLVSLLNPSKMRATVVPDKYPLVECSSEFGVFRVLDGVSPYEVLALLHLMEVRQQLAPLGRGSSSSRRRISPSDVLTLLVPSWNDKKADEVSLQTQRAVENILQAQSFLSSIEA